MQVDAKKNRARTVLGHDRRNERPQPFQGVCTAEVVLVEHGRCKTRLGEDHHAEGGLQKTLTRSRSHDEEEAVLHFVMQPADRRERTEIVAFDNVGVRIEQMRAPECRVLVILSRREESDR